MDVSQVPVHPHSSGYMGYLRKQIGENQNEVPINTSHYNTSFYQVPADAKRITLEFNNCQDKPDIPEGLFDGAKHFVDVPIPDEAQPTRGGDAQLTVWSPDSDQLWEFWGLRKINGKWAACWGGRIDGVSESDGRFPYPYGASASGLATIGTMITLAEARSLRIDHALNLGLKRMAQENYFVYPANRSDGKENDPDAMPMGARLRLDPSVDVDALKMSTLGKAIARAAQQYGFIVTESSGVVAIGAESGQRTLQNTGKDPWATILGKTPDYLQMHGFPWDKVEVLEFGYGEPQETTGQ